MITYIRSSSYTGYDWCQMQFYMNYVLGMPKKSIIEASRGTCVHKVLEMLASKKLLQQLNSSDPVRDDETGTSLAQDECTPDRCLDIAFDYYSKREDYLNWEGQKDFCRKCVYIALESDLSPLKQTVIAPEIYFDEIIDYPWATYDYTINGQNIVGKLALRGTIDLTVEDGTDGIAYIDYKTGKSTNYTTRKPKTYEDVHADPQMRLYHWAIAKKFPHIKYITINLYYIAENRIYTVCFEEKDLEETAHLIRRRFEQIKNLRKPTWVWDKPRERFKCRMCSYSEIGSKGIPLCHEVKQDIIMLGIDKVTAQRADLSKLTHYQSGGGKSAEKR